MIKVSLGGGIARYRPSALSKGRLGNHYPVICVASVMESDLIKEIITNLKGGDNVPVVWGGNGEEEIV